jgi:hypothetical protein
MLTYMAICLMATLIVARRGKHTNAPFDEGNEAGLLDNELPGEA